MTDLDHAEIDRLVSERVMGECAHRQQYLDPQLGWWYCPQCRLQGGDSIMVPAYSERIELAWEVVERLRAQGWSFRLWAPADRQCVATFGRFLLGDRCCVERFRDTAAEAICAAALQAVGEGEA